MQPATLRQRIQELEAALRELLEKKPAADANAAL